MPGYLGCALMVSSTATIRNKGISVACEQAAPWSQHCIACFGWRCCVFSIRQTLRRHTLPRSVSAYWPNAAPRWGPTADYLSAHVDGHHFTIVPLNFDEIFPAVDRGDVDFILVNSAIYVTLEVQHGASRIATLRNRLQGKAYTDFGGVIFVRADNPEIKRISDLRGHSFMAVDETSLGGYEAALRELVATGIEAEHDFRPLQFAGTHDAVVYAVLSGEVTAGTVRSDTLERMAGEGKIRLEDFRVLRAADAVAQERFPFLISTRLYPEWPFAALPHISPELAQEVAVALMQMPENSPAAVAAKCAGWSVPRNYQPVHELLQELHLPPYQLLGQISLSGLLHRYWPVLILMALLFLGLVGYVLNVSRLNQRLLLSDSALRQSLQKLDNANSQLFQAEKMAAIGQLAAGVAHEINNPMAYVSSNLNSLLHYLDGLDKFFTAYEEARKNGEISDECIKRMAVIEQQLDLPYLRRDLRELVEESLDGSARVKKIVADLKDFARRDNSEWEEANVNDLLDIVLNIVHNELKYKADIRKEYGDVPATRCVRRQLEQVFANLLVNAAQAIAEHGTITIRSRHDTTRDQVVIEIADTGCGIAEQDMAHLFEPFFTTKPVGQGTGLGLSISYKIVQRHGGTIEAESKPGQGSLFRVLLPLHFSPLNSEPGSDTV